MFPVSVPRTGFISKFVGFLNREGFDTVTLATVTIKGKIVSNKKD